MSAQQKILAQFFAFNGLADNLADAPVRIRREFQTYAFKRVGALLSPISAELNCILDMLPSRYRR